MPILVTCQCGKPYSVSDDNAGKRVRCRACGAVIDVPSPAPPFNPPDVQGSPSPPPSPPPVPIPAPVASIPAAGVPHQPRTPVGASAQGIVLIILSVVFILAAVVSSESGFSTEAYTNRFKNDNAVGATANALEYLARSSSHSNGPILLIAALLCWILVKFDRIARILER